MATRADGNKRTFDGASAEELWARLAGDMRAARQAAGIRASDWGGAPDVPWTRAHLSNLEHGRGKPTPAIAELYDRKCPHPSDPAYFRRLQASAAAADQRKKGAVRGAQKVRRSGPGGDARRSTWAPRWLPIAAAAGVSVVAVLAIIALRDGGGESPSTGIRRVCARDLILRDSPGPVRGGEPELYGGEAIEVDRYGGGPDGPHMYAHGVARGRDARGRGWVTEKYLCD